MTTPLDALRSDASAPEGMRLMLVSEDLWDTVLLRTDDGRRLTVAWGDPDGHGWYSPTFTATEDEGYLIRRSAPDASARLAALVMDALAETRRRYVGTPPNVDDYDVACAAALDDAAERIRAALAATPEPPRPDGWAHTSANTTGGGNWTLAPATDAPEPARG